MARKSSSQVPDSFSSEFVQDRAPQASTLVPLKPGENPRSKFRRKHKERGPARYYYTVERVATLVGLTRVTVQRHSSLGKVDMSSLESVTSYIFAFRSKPQDMSGLRLLSDVADELDVYIENHRLVLEPARILEARAQVAGLRAIVKKGKL